jgi:hypothetical protein
MLVKPFSPTALANGTTIGKDHVWPGMVGSMLLVNKETGWDAGEIS